MLHRAANNAYSWWWASHIRTKQSKWLDNNLQEMEEKVQYMLKLIDEDGDSFARRAESYYRKRPELINFVEEFYRAYRALAEKYDHISGELQNANHTIATVFPDRVQFAMDEDEEAGSPHISAAFRPLSKSIPDVPKAIPKFIKNLKKGKGSLGRPPKIHPNKNKSTTTNSNMSKEEAIQEIDRLQKGILALQTEKEFVKSSYENRLAKYWEIEKSITEMQQQVCGLQDEFRVGTLIEDHEARTLMAATALNSCQQTLTQLQEKQERSNEEARVEQERIKEVHLKFEAFKGEFLQNQNGQNPFETEATSEDPTVKLSEQGVGDVQEETVDAESIREKIREQFQIIYGNDLSVSELAEKIDELATKVISLETAVSTQTALIRRLKSETDSLQENLRTLEEDKAAMLQDSTKLNERLRELEGKLHEVQDLGKNVDNQNNNLQTHFTEANCNLDHLSEKLKDVKPDEETEITDSIETEDSLFPTVDQRKKQELGSEMVPSEESASEKAKLTGEEEVQEHNLCVTDPGEGLGKSTSSSQPEDVSGASPDIKKLSDGEKQPDSSRTEDKVSQEELGDQEDEPNWQQLFSNGLEDRERLLLGEYTAIVRKYKEARKQLSELQRKDNDSQFEIMVQLRELKNAIAIKDEEIQSLRQKLKSMQESERASENLQQEEKAQDMIEAMSSQPQSSPVANVEQQPISDSLQDQKDDATPRSDVSTAGNSPKSLTHTEEEEELKVPPVDEPRHVSSIEEKFRKDIDGLLEENLDFWMRFSELFHQIQKFQTSIKDLKNEYTKIKENKNSEEGSSSSKHSDSLRSDARPIYKHLREIQTELTVWIEKNMLLKDEVKYRLASLGNIQEEIERVSHHSSGTDEEFTSYQAAKFQGEVLNMEQENNKVAGELQAGREHIKELQIEIDNTLTQIDDELKLSGSRIHHHHNVIHSLSRTRIPLRSLLFGVRAKKQKPPSFFACINPTLNKQHSDLDGGYDPL